VVSSSPGGGVPVSSANASWASSTSLFISSIASW
jgi:hypothetical protein